MHFQYNGLLLGLLMLSLEALQRDRVVLSAFLFAVLLNMKHLFAVAAPYFLVYMLKRYCLDAKRVKQFLSRFFLLGATVIGVCGASLGPVVLTGNAENLLQRLFPFGRGLCHAYWAPNAWALYSVADKALVRALALLPSGLSPLLGAMSGAGDGRGGRGHLSGGLVGVSKFEVLPQVGPSATLVLVLLAMLPCLVKMWIKPKRSHRAEILQDVAYVNLCGFVFGYHVHEKAVLHFMIPMAFGAVLTKARAAEHAWASWPAYISLMPLLFGPQERLLKQLVAFGYCAALHWQSLAPGAGRGRGRGKGRASSVLPAAYAALLAAVHLYGTYLHEMAFGPSRLEFLPLLLYSVTSALGIVALFCRQCLDYCTYIHRHFRSTT